MKPKPKAKRKPAKKPVALTEVQRLKKEIRELTVRNNFLGKNAAEFGRKALAIEALLRVIVPNARRWIETALQGPEPERERLLQWNLTESGILAAEAIIGRLQVAQPMREPPPTPREEGYGRSGTATLAEVKPDAE